jgi:hypothetical protein
MKSAMKENGCGENIIEIIEINESNSEMAKLKIMASSIGISALSESSRISENGGV